MTTPTTGHNHGFTLRKNTSVFPWTIAVIATVLAIVLGILLVQQRGNPATAVEAGGKSDFKVHFEPAMAGEEKILEFVADTIAPDYGIEIEPVGLQDPIQANQAVASGQFDATIFEHQWYMQQSAEAAGVELTPTVELYQWGFGLYSTRYASVEDLPQGATLLLPNDVANQGQALWLLEREGLLGLDPDIEPRTAKMANVVQNPHGFVLKEADLLAMPRMLDDVDVAIGYVSQFDAGKVGRDKGILFPEPPRTFASRLIFGSEFAQTTDAQKLIEVFSDPRLQEYLATTDDPLVQGVLTPVSAD
ncbi:MetQ/NlpA family ABC transporter substrate-binding protein [Glutamicibacter sp. MNS18]|uniref:MetQ/NlpA family ABC transporter substrate-binding protein n=1 Tax=Glutamicibacter sp. MNS18 TaxID=2989817 RepID=UPI0022355AD1|nr:MetQ/NlpA family ABC transporter substrate-binding protein [Glutamicibacter sp. MNS18]MCW4465930.1 MetQ/NlpA family ABC transporter substrate-binding protein [Glutamicibacter sp. MNS18]